MTFDLFLALFVFGFIAAFTPGPNNTMLLATGINFGVRRAWPHIMGVCIGFPLMIACIGFGLGRIFELYPWIYVVLKYAGAAYMIWLAWKIATSKPSVDDGIAAGEPVTFVQACAFQWVNPKAWIMGVTALSAYTVATQYTVGVMAVVGTFVFMGFTSALTWVLFGAGLKHILSDARYYRYINWGLAAALVASLVPMLWH
jgi:threonine/homoserine/homoserine lactone efflux protein